MRTIIQYMKQYGNKSFEEFPFNEVDSLILCEMSYCNFDLVCPQTTKWDNKVFYYDWVFNPDTIVPLSKETIAPLRVLKFLQVFLSCERYKKMKVGHIVNQLDYDEVVQFYAVTFIFPYFTYICYRGTDITMLGWRENMNMALMEEIPAQRLALFYINEVAELHPHNIFVGGHSKGGNLAMYASMYCQKSIKDRIINVYDFDGPGFNFDPYNDPEFIEIEDRIEKFSTKSPLVGVLLNYYENVQYINCRGVSIMQHDPFNWGVTKSGKLNRLNKISGNVKTVSNAIRYFLLETTTAEREEFIDLLFKIINSNPYAKVTELIYSPFRTIRSMFKRYKELDIKEQLRFKHLGRRFTKYLFHPNRPKKIALTKKDKFNKMLAKQEQMTETC